MNIKPQLNSPIDRLVQFWTETKMPLTTKECVEMSGVSSCTLRWYRRRGLINRTFDIFMAGDREYVRALWMLSDQTKPVNRADKLYEIWGEKNEWISTVECAKILGITRSAAYQTLEGHRIAGRVVKEYRKFTLSPGITRQYAAWKKA